MNNEETYSGFEISSNGWNADESVASEYSVDESSLSKKFTKKLALNDDRVQ